MTLTPFRRVSAAAVMSLIAVATVVSLTRADTNAQLTTASDTDLPGMAAVAPNVASELEPDSVDPLLADLLDPILPSPTLGDTALLDPTAVTSASGAAKPSSKPTTGSKPAPTPTTAPPAPAPTTAPPAPAPAPAPAPSPSPTKPKPKNLLEILGLK